MNPPIEPTQKIQYKNQILKTSNGNNGYDITLNVCGKIGTRVPVSSLIHEVGHYVGNTYYRNITASGYISIGQNNDVANGQFYYNN